MSPEASRSYASRWPSVVGLGIALGVATAWVDVRAGELEQDGLWRATSMVLNSGSAWAALAVASGWLIGRPVAGAVAGTVSLVAAVAGYYAFGVLAGDRTNVGLAGSAGPSGSGHCSPSSSDLSSESPEHSSVARVSSGLVALFVVPIGIAVEMLGLRRLRAETFAVDPVLAWAQSAMIAVAALGAGSALVVRLRRPAIQSGDRLGTTRYA